MFFCTLFYLVLTTIVFTTDSKAVQHNFHSDVIVTQWPTKSPLANNENEDQPGFVVRIALFILEFYLNNTFKKLKMVLDLWISIFKFFLLTDCKCITNETINIIR